MLEVGDRVIDDLGQYGVVKEVEESIGTFWVALDSRSNAWFPYPPEDLKKRPSEPPEKEGEMLDRKEVHLFHAGTKIPGWINRYAYYSEGRAYFGIDVLVLRDGLRCWVMPTKPISTGKSLIVLEENASWGTTPRTIVLLDVIEHELASKEIRDAVEAMLASRTEQYQGEATRSEKEEE